MKKLLGKGKILVTYLSVFSVLAASILSVFTGVNIGVIAENGTPSYTVWDGKDESPKNVTYDDGEGTSVDPFIISNADQLYRMVFENGAPEQGKPAFYKLANDIYLNDISNYESWGSSTSGVNNWADGLTDKEFIGSFDGDGHTVYGMYAKGGSAGFIPKIGVGTATIKNLNLDKFYVQATTSGQRGGAGALIGLGDSTSKGGLRAAFVTNCAVTNGTVKGSYAAAIFAQRFESPLTLKNTLVADVEVVGTSYQGGIFADGWTNLAYADNCVFIGISPLGNK